MAFVNERGSAYLWLLEMHRAMVEGFLERKFRVINGDFNQSTRCRYQYTSQKVSKKKAVVCEESAHPLVAWQQTWEKNSEVGGLYNRYIFRCEHAKIIT